MSPPSLAHAPVQALLAFLALMCLIAGFIVYLDRLQDAPPLQGGPLPTVPVVTHTTSAGAGGSSSSTSAAAPAAGGGGGMLGGLMGAGTAAGPQRVYTSGTRLEELLGWPGSVDAPEALYMYISQMEGEEQEALFSALPQVVNCVTGLDTNNAQRAWLNQQAFFLKEPGKNVRLAKEIDQKVCALLLPQPAAAAVPVPAATGGVGIGMGSMLGRGAKSATRRSGLLFDKLITGGGISYTFLADGGTTNSNYKLPHAVRLALAQGHYANTLIQIPPGVDMIPRIFLNQLQVQAQQQLSWPPGSPGGGGGGNGAPSLTLVLGSWDYFLYCFALWPLSDRGDEALDIPSASVVSPVVAGVGEKFGLGSTPVEKPLYLRLLKGYLNFFLPIGKPPPAGAAEFTEVLSQFWLCQNPSPAVETLLKQEAEERRKHGLQTGSQATPSFLMT